MLTLAVLGVMLLTLVLLVPLGLVYLFARQVLAVRPGPSLALLVAGGAASVVSDQPWWLLAAVAAVAVAQVRRRPPRAAAPPSALLSRPWSQLGLEAEDARSRFARVVTGTRPGPLRRQLEDLGADVDAAVAEAWRLARHGDSVSRAHREVVAAVRTQRRRGAGGGGATMQERRLLWESLQAQRASADRLSALCDADQARLQLLVARLDELVAQALELTAQGAAANPGSPLGERLIALRLASAEVEELAAG